MVYQDRNLYVKVSERYANAHPIKTCSDVPLIVAPNISAVAYGKNKLGLSLCLLVVGEQYVQVGNRVLEKESGQQELYDDILDSAEVFGGTYSVCVAPLVNIAVEPEKRSTISAREVMDGPSPKDFSLIYSRSAYEESSKVSVPFALYGRRQRMPFTIPYVPLLISTAIDIDHADLPEGEFEMPLPFTPDTIAYLTVASLYCLLDDTRQAMVHDA